MGDDNQGSWYDRLLAAAQDAAKKGGWGVTLTQQATSDKPPPAQTPNATGQPYDEVTAEDTLRKNIDAGETGQIAAREGGRDPRYGGVRPTVVAGRDWDKLGGRARVEGATDVPLEVQSQAAANTGDLEAQEQKKLHSTYTALSEQVEKQNALRLSHYQDAYAELEKRQKEIEKRTELYSRNLADRGAFWKDPGNVVAAIGFALMPFASDDKAIGIKLINQAIQGDWEQRKKMADTDIGNLQSNMTGYRQLMGDRDAGDQMGLAMAYKQAALEVEKISAEFKGPKAKEAANAIIGHLTGQYNLLYMEAASKMHMPPQLMDPYRAKAWNNMPGFQSYTGQPSQPGQAAPTAGSAESAGASSPVGPPQTAGPSAAPTATGTLPSGGYQETRPGATPWRPGDQLSPGARVASASEQPAGGPGMDVDFAKKRPGIAKILISRGANPQQMQNIYNEVHTQAERESKSPRGTPAEQAKYEEIWDKAEAGVSEIAKNADKHLGEVQMYSAMHRDIMAVEKFFKGDRVKIADWLGILRKNAPDMTNKLDNLYTSMGMNDPKGNQRDAINQAARRFSQAMADVTVAYYHSKIAGAWSEHELKAINQVISSKSDFDQMKDFVVRQSRDAASKWDNALKTGGEKSLLARRLYLIDKGLAPTPVLPYSGKPE